MSANNHPSPKNLSAYFDKELAAGERQIVESHLSDCQACKAELEAFAVMSELGPVIEESLPGDAYWKDLPDRILARIAQPEPAPAAQTASGPFWRRWLQPQGGMPLAWGSVGMMVVVAGAWLVMRGQPNPANPVDIASNNPAPESTSSPAAPPASMVPDHVRKKGSPALNPQSYTRRVLTTYGNRDNMGVSLDVQPGETAQSSGGSGIGQQVSMLPGYAQSNPHAPTTLKLGPKAQEFAQGVVSQGCGESNPLEAAFIAALKAEEAGNYDLAKQGFQLVRDNLPPGQALHHEADFRLHFVAWRQQLESSWAQRVEAMNQLHRLAENSYKVWEESKANTDCQEAWCMNRVLLKLAPELTSQNRAQLMVTRVNKLQNCVE